MLKNIKLQKGKTISFLKLPFDFFEKNYADISPDTLKVFMYILYLCTLGKVEIDTKELAKKLNMTEKSIINAYAELEKEGFLIVNTETGQEEIVNLESYYKHIHKENFHETKKEINLDVLNADDEFSQKLRFLEDVYGKEFTENDLFEIYDLLNNQGIPMEVLACAIGYSEQKKIKNLNYISKVALNWKELGLTSYESCEKYIAEGNTIDDNLYRNISNIMNLQRSLYDVEKKYVDSWYNEHHKTLEEIKSAFEKTVINTGKASFPYMNKILLSDGTNVPSKSKSINKNSLNNFEGREYDYDEIMSAIRKKQNG